MRSHLNMPKWAWSALTMPVVLSAAIITGCGPNADDPEVKRQIQERREAISQDEAQENAQAKKIRGKRAAVVKSIKGNLGAGQAD
jgi:hypothetical protein